VGEEHTRGNNAASDREGAAPSGWVRTQVAAKSLGISPRTVRWHIEHGNLEAKPEGEGVRRSWLVSIDSVQAFRDSRQRQGQLLGGSRGEPGDADIAAESSGNAIRELADRLVEEAARASEYRVRLELSEKAQSTLEEQLVEERRRREEAERAREDLRRELQALREARESPETVEEAPDRAEPRPDTVEAQDELGAERARREMAETTLHEGMAEQRRRREEAERERDELRRQLYARKEPRESPESPDPSGTPTEEGSRSTETPVEHPEGEEVWLDAEGREAQPQEATESPEMGEEPPERAEPLSAPGGAQEGTQRPRSRPWWRRIIGG
jgi:hypothetical protein